MERKVVDIAEKLKFEKSDVTVSEIEMCKEKNIFLIGHGKKIKANHLNSSKLQLNRSGAKILELN